MNRRSISLGLVTGLAATGLATPAFAGAPEGTQSVIVQDAESASAAESAEEKAAEDQEAAEKAAAEAQAEKEAAAQEAAEKEAAENAEREAAEKAASAKAAAEKAAAEKEAAEKEASEATEQEPAQKPSAEKASDQSTKQDVARTSSEAPTASPGNASKSQEGPAASAKAAASPEKVFFPFPTSVTAATVDKAGSLPWLEGLTAINDGGWENTGAGYRIFPASSPAYDRDNPQAGTYSFKVQKVGKSAAHPNGTEIVDENGTKRHPSNKNDTWTVTVSGRTGVSVTANARAKADERTERVVIAVHAVNNEDKPADIRFVTPFGEKVFTKVAPGQGVYHEFDTALGSIPAGTVKVNSYVGASAGNAARYQVRTLDYDATTATLNPRGTASAEAFVHETEGGVYLRSTFRNTGAHPVNARFKTAYGDSDAQIVAPGATATFQVKTGKASVPAGSGLVAAYKYIEGKGYYSTFSVMTPALQDTAPRVTFTTPSAGQSFDGTVGVSGTAKDDAAIQDGTLTLHVRKVKATGSLDGFILGKTQTVAINADGTWSTTVDVSDLAPGQYGFTAIAKDVFGQQNPGGGTHLKAITVTAPVAPTTPPETTTEPTTPPETTTEPTTPPETTTEPTTPPETTTEPTTPPETTTEPTTPPETTTEPTTPGEGTEGTTEPTIPGEVAGPIAPADGNGSTPTGTKSSQDAGLIVRRTVQPLLLAPASPQAASTNADNASTTGNANTTGNASTTGNAKNASKVGNASSTGEAIQRAAGIDPVTLTGNDYALGQQTTPEKNESSPQAAGLIAAILAGLGSFFFLLAKRRRHVKQDTAA